MDTNMQASHALAEPGVDHVTLAFIDADSTVNVSVPLVEAARLSTALERAVKKSGGIRVALSR